MAINTKSGTDASVKINTTTILAIESWDFTNEREALKAGVFGDTHNKVHGMGIKNTSGSISGYYSEADTTGQEVLKTAFEDGTTVSGFRCYVDATIYYHATGTDDIDGVYITSHNVSAAQNGIIPITFNFEVGGAWTEVTS